jgi:hypothetical protein
VGDSSAGIKKSITGSEEPLDVDSRFSEEAPRSEPQAFTLVSRTESINLNNCSLSTNYRINIISIGSGAF